MKSGRNSPVNGTGEHKPRRNETGLDVCGEVFSDAALQGLIADWIVPMIVDNIIDEMIKQGSR